MGYDATTMCPTERAVERVAGPGECGRCRWARTVASARGASYLRCERSDSDPRYARYPHLPVSACPGYETTAVAAREADSVPRPRMPISLTPSDEGPQGQDQNPPPPLIELVGGAKAVARIVDEFYNRVEDDPQLRPLFPADLTQGREKQRLFMTEWLGGAPAYSQRYGHPRLRRRHFPFVIDQGAAGRWLRHMGEAMRACEVDATVVAAVMERLGPLAKHMVNAGEDVPRTPLPDAFLT